MGEVTQISVYSIPYQRLVTYDYSYLTQSSLERASLPTQWLSECNTPLVGWGVDKKNWTRKSGNVTF